MALSGILDQGRNHQAAGGNDLKAARREQRAARPTALEDVEFAAAMDRGADVGAAGGDDLVARADDRAAGSAAGADDLVPAAEHRSAGNAARPNDLLAAEGGSAAGEPEHDLRAAGDLRIEVGAVGADDLGAAGEDDRRVGNPAGGDDQLAAARYGRVDV